MSVWALADLHLAFGCPEKSMEVFGETWKNYTQKIESQWRENINPDDLVLLPGDISWGLRIQEAKVDLDWIHSLPGTKMMIRGNHDYWWTSLKQVEKILPASIHLIQNNSIQWNQYIIGGTRLWDTPEYKFNEYIQYAENPRVKKIVDTDPTPDAEKIFIRELGRLELSLKSMDKFTGEKIAMTHYPPIGAELKESRASSLLNKYHVKICVFGHLHNVKKDALPFGEREGTRFLLTSADYLDFKPIQIL